MSIAVERDGEPFQLAAGPIELEFEERGGGDVVRWYAGCNTIGGVFDITSDQLQPRQTPDGQPEFTGTTDDCPEEQLEQDVWLADVFGSAPQWTLDEDGTLRITNGRDVFVLEPSGESS